jgi:hypothetical protein
VATIAFVESSLSNRTDWVRDGSNAVFTLLRSPVSWSVVAEINAGPAVACTVAGANVTLAVIPQAGDDVTIRYFANVDLTVPNTFSALDICNLALSHLGDTAAVTSIDPPDGSAQSVHCARFYNIALSSLLEMHTWEITTMRAELELAEGVEAFGGWSYVYEVPLGVGSIISVISTGSETPQAFLVEMLEGRKVILTNQDEAILRYTAPNADASSFGPLFVLALSWLLASMLAGPIIKGEAGAAENKRCLAMFARYLGEATASDASGQNVRPAHTPPWIAGR